MMRGRIIWRDVATDAGLVGPATLAMLVLIFGPALIVGILSFTDYQFGARGFNWVGLGNYLELFTDPIGRKAVVNTLIYVAVVMPPRCCWHFWWRSGFTLSPGGAGAPPISFASLISCPWWRRWSR